MNQTKKSYKSLLETIGKVVIISYKESTEDLEMFLESEGFLIEAIKSKPEEEISYSSSAYRTFFFGHRKAMDIAITQNKPTLIMEADFVPVVGFGKLPLPFDRRQNNTGICWLYTCGPRMYWVTKDGFIQGGAAGAQAYIVTQISAGILATEFAEMVKQKSLNGSQYYPWDADIDGFFIKKGLKNYIAFRNYGEHGGVIRKEHRGKVKRGGWHRADVLYGKLAFLPQYAHSSRFPRITYFHERLKGWIHGLLRLLAGKYLRLKIIFGSSAPFRLIKYAILRYLPLRYCIGRQKSSNK